MKKLLLIIIMLSSKIVFAQCNGQDKYIATWNITDDKAKLEVHLKTNKPFSYYSFFDEGFIFIGLPYKINTEVTIKVPDNIGKSYESYGPFMYKGANPQRVKELFYPYNAIPRAINGNKYSGVFQFPLSEKHKQTQVSHIREFEYTDIINNYKNLFDYNDLYGKHKIKFYVTLLESSDLEQCALFESPIVEINIGRKPFKKIWNDLFQ